MKSCKNCKFFLKDYRFCEKLHKYLISNTKETCNLYEEKEKSRKAIIIDWINRRKIKKFQGASAWQKYPLGIDEILGEIEYLFDDKEVSQVINKYQKDYSHLWDCVERFYKMKELLEVNY